MGYVLNKQILVFVERDVVISGLASKRVVLQFDPNNLQEINNFFDKYMVQIRENIKNKKNTEFLLNSLIALGITGGLILLGLGAYQFGKDISKFIKTTKTGYIKSNFRLKNIGEITANKISIRLFCTTIPTIKFLNKWNYKIKILKHDGLKLNNFPSITGQIKREKRIKNPTVVPTKRDDKVNWSFQYEIDKIAPDDSQKLPPIYINIPKNLRKGEIKFNAKIFSEESVNYDDEILTLFWEV